MNRYYGNGTYLPSEYKHVSGVRYGDGSIDWKFYITNIRRDSAHTCATKSGFLTEREAAIAADKFLISIGREPANILKRKKVEA